jgi:hypothetical protein
VWHDGTTIPTPAFSAWEGGEPDGGPQNCLALRASSDKWIDRECDSLYFAICDVPTGTLIPDCSSNIVDGSTRAYCTTPRTFDDAVAECASGGGTLAHIDDDDENAQLSTAADVVALDQIWWIGATDIPFEGVWTWLDDGTLIDDF